MLKTIPFLLLSLMILNACSQGGRKASGNACPRGNYDPYAVELDDETLSKNKMQRLDISAELPVGHFAYVSSDFIYDNEAINDGIEGPTEGIGLIVHLRDVLVKESRDSAEEYKSQNVCFRGFRSGLNFNFNQEVITDIFKAAPQEKTDINPDETEEINSGVTIQTKSYTFTNTDIPEAISGKPSKPIASTLSNFFAKYPNAEIAMYQYLNGAKGPAGKPFNYDLRGSYDGEDHDGRPIKYRFLIRLQKAQ